MDATKELTEHIADRKMATTAVLMTPGTARKLTSTANITVEKMVTLLQSPLSLLMCLDHLG
jgi:hypothetical protein